MQSVPSASGIGRIAKNVRGKKNLVESLRKEGEWMQNDKLLPCPFCGGNNVGVWHNRSVSPLIKGSCEVHCYDCHFGLAQVKTEEEAINYWNTRKPMERIVARLEELFKHHNATKTVQRLVLETVKDWWCR